VKAVLEVFIGMAAWAAVLAQPMQRLIVGNWGTRVLS